MFTTSPLSHAALDTPMSSFHSNTVGDLRNSASAHDYTVFGSMCPEFLGFSAKDALVREMMRYMVVMQRRDSLGKLSVQVNDNAITPENAPGFSIEVSCAKITPATASTLPKILSSGFE
ncbi:hypothetical protein AALT_g8661 [Alternaria alternata]|nr:hypothetical protein AALT_g8661 [Alternaria alternata]